MNKDAFYMRRALDLAKKAQGNTSPNPLVGAVLVNNGRVIGQGYHKKCGLPHAEMIAFKNCRSGCRGATLYVNLEPCAHFGRTPPCVDEVIRRGIKRVVIAGLDPNPLTAGKSVKKMRAAGIKVDIGCLAKEAAAVNEVFFHNMRAGMPFVAAKWAQSLDGKLVSYKGRSKWITAEPARRFAKHLRDKYDAVLVGVNTAIKDDPQLNGSRKIPVKIVLDPRSRLPRRSKLAREYADKLIVIKGTRGRIDLKQMLKKLYQSGITSVFVEGGACALGGFFDAGLVNKVYCFIAPKILGSQSALSAVGGKGFISPNNCPVLKDFEILPIGSDFLLTGYPQT